MNFRRKSIYTACLMMLSSSLLFGQTDSCAQLWACEASEYKAAETLYEKNYNAWLQECSGPAREGNKNVKPSPQCGSLPPFQPALATYIANCSKKFSCTSSSYVLDYELVDLMYSPPGKASSVTYTASSGAGSTWGLSTTQGSSSTVKTSVGVSTGVGTASAGFTFDTSTTQGSSTTNATDFQFTSTLATSEGLASPSTDSVDHNQDTFYLLIKPAFTVIPGSTPGYTVVVTPPAPGSIQPFTVSELIGAESVPSDKAQFLAALSPQDKQQILQTDLFSSNPGYVPPPCPPAGQSNATPCRYVPLPCPPPGQPAGAPCASPQQLDGPDNPGDDRPTFGVQLSYASSGSSKTTDTQTAQASTGFTFNVSGGPPFFKVSESFGESNATTWSSSTSSGTVNTSQYNANTVFSTTTVGFHDLIDIYFDTVYNTFVFVSETNGQGIPADEKPSISGTLTRNGKTLANSPVVVKFSNGTTREVFTNAKGIYRVYRAPEGAATVETIGRTKNLIVDRTKPVLLDIKR